MFGVWVLYDRCMTRTGRAIKVEEVLMGGKEGEGDEVGMSIAYVIERHIFLK